MHGFVAIWVAMLLGCTPEAPALGEPAVHVAVAGPMSGKNAFQGQEMTRAAELAVAQANLAGGVGGRRVTLDVYDDDARPPAEIARTVAASPAVVVALVDSGGPEMQQFVRDYEARFSRVPDTSGAAYYDAARLALAAAAGVDGMDLAADRARVRDALALRRGPDTAWTGALGATWFDARRTAVRDIAVGTFVGGTLVSAPVQLTRLETPERVPDLDARLAAGTALRLGERTYAKVAVAYVGIDVVELSTVDFASRTFVADLYLWLRHAGDLRPEELELASAAEPTALGEPMWTRTRGDLTTSTWRVRTTFVADFDFRDYPFDRQALRVEVRPASRTTASLVLALDRLGMRTADGARPQDALAARLGAAGAWHLLDLVTFQDEVRASSTLGEVGISWADAGLRFSRVSAVATLTRDVRAFALRGLLPLGVILSILYGAWFLPHSELGTRTTITITAVLTVSVLHQQLGDLLPGVGYLVAMDYAYYTSLLLALAATFASIAVYLLDRAARPAIAHALDLAGRIGMPLVLALLAWGAWARFG